MIRRRTFCSLYALCNHHRRQSLRLRKIPIRLFIGRLDQKKEPGEEVGTCKSPSSSQPFRHRPSPKQGIQQTCHRNFLFFIYDSHVCVASYASSMCLLATSARDRLDADRRRRTFLFGLHRASAGLLCHSLALYRGCLSLILRICPKRLRVRLV